MKSEVVYEALAALQLAEHRESVASAASYAVLKGLETLGWIRFDRGWHPGPRLHAARFARKAETQTDEDTGVVIPFPLRTGSSMALKSTQ